MNYEIVDLHKNGIKVEIDGVTIGRLKVPSDYVPRNWVPDIENYQLVGGKKLIEGATVLIEDAMFREDLPEDALDVYRKGRADETSRWCIVTDLEFNRGYEIVSFTGIYADGTMRRRSYNTSIRWVVPKKFEMQPYGPCPDCGVNHLDDSSEYAGFPDEETQDAMARAVTRMFLGEELGFEELQKKAEEVIQSRGGVVSITEIRSDDEQTVDDETAESFLNFMGDVLNEVITKERDSSESDKQNEN